MESIGKLVKEHPVITVLVAVGAGLLAYHNGALNFMFSEPSKAGVKADEKTA